MIYVLLLVAVLLFSGIFLLVHFLKKPVDEPLPTLADQHRAFQIVWKVYGVPDDVIPPSIRYVRSDQLNCFAGLGWKTSDGRCVAGVSWEDQNACAVAWPVGTKKLSQTSFAHELWHAATWVLGGLDPDHTGPGFAPGGQVEQANKALREAGL